jgi:hypothetical protein
MTEHTPIHFETPEGDVVDYLISEYPGYVTLQKRTNLQRPYSILIPRDHLEAVVCAMRGDSGLPAPNA